MSACRVVCVLFLSVIAFASVASAASPTEPAPASSEAVADAAAVPDSPAPNPEAELSAEQVGDVAPDQQLDAEAEGENAEGETGDAENDMPSGVSHVTLTDRVGFGMVGSTMFVEYGLQIEVASPHFGIKAHWGAWVPYPTNVDFSFTLGFALHYYPFGDGPNGLYVGPGFQFTNIYQNQDPMRMADQFLREQLVRERLAEGNAPDGARMPPSDPVTFGMIINHRTGFGRRFNLLTPMLEVGYRHSWPERESPVYFTMGVELMLGYAVSDMVNMWDSNFTFMLHPQLGLTW